MQAFDTGNNTDALIKYSVGLRFYEKVNNLNFAGIICNNIANIYLQQGDMRRSFEYYEKSINYGMNKSVNKQVIISRKQNMAKALIAYFYKKKKLDQDLNRQDRMIQTESKLEREKELKNIMLRLENCCIDIYRYYITKTKDYLMIVEYGCILCWVQLELNNMKRCANFLKECED